MFIQPWEEISSIVLVDDSTIFQLDMGMSLKSLLVRFTPGIFGNDPAIITCFITIPATPPSIPDVKRTSFRKHRHQKKRLGYGIMEAP